MTITTPNLYLKGTFNGWGLDTPLSQINTHQLSASVVLSADTHRFKVADMDGTARWTFSAYPDRPLTLTPSRSTPLITTQGIGNDLLFTPNAADRFTVTLDFSNEQPVIKVEKHNNDLVESVSRERLWYQLNSRSEPRAEIKDAPYALSADELFNQLAIESETAFPFVFGDNIDGYFEGTTHSLRAAGRYRHHQGWHLGGFASLVNGELNDKQHAEKARLMPFGIEHHYPGSRDCFSLIHNQRMAYFNVDSEQAAHLSIVPELNISLSHSDIESVDNVVVISVNPDQCPEGCPRFVAISADQPIAAQELSVTDFPQLEQAMGLSTSNTNWMLTAIEPCKSLTVYLCFAHDKQQVINAAKTASINNGYQQYKKELYQFLTSNYLWTSDLEYNRAVMWARLASRTFVSKEFGRGIWAGLPWFKDCWGRDTFIALSGTCLVNGQFKQAREIIDNFASMQMTDPDSLNLGRIPNRVTSKTNIIYNTTDGTPWLIREIGEYIDYSGDDEYAKAIYPMVKRFIQGVEKHYLDSDGLIKHRHPDTWMDAKIEGQIPWSPRGPKANDIQALWYESLQVAKQLAELNQDSEYIDHLHSLLSQVTSSFSDKFWDGDQLRLADRLGENDVADYSVRPNQLMTLTIPQTTKLVSPDVGQYMVKNCVEQLLFPWGICSLDQYHQDFHPYHDNRSEYHKDAAYHNGTIWGWNAGFTVSALVQYDQQDLAYRLSKNLAKQLLGQGHRGTMSENLDAFQADEDNLIESGTYAQAWSVSEYARNAQQDYLGFKPLLSVSKIKLTPRLPNCWETFSARVPFGDSNALLVTFEKEQTQTTYTVSTLYPDPELKLELQLELGCEHLDIITDTEQQLKVTLNSVNQTFSLDREVDSAKLTTRQHYPLLDNLTFSKPDWERSFNCLSESSYLLNKRSHQGLSIATDRN